MPLPCSSSFGFAPSASAPVEVRRALNVCASEVRTAVETEVSGSEEPPQPASTVETATKAAAATPSSLDAVALASFLGCSGDDVGNGRHLGHLELSRRAS